MEHWLSVLIGSSIRSWTWPWCHRYSLLLQPHFNPVPCLKSLTVTWSFRVTESTPVVLHTESVDRFTHTGIPVYLFNCLYSCLIVPLSDTNLSIWHTCLSHFLIFSASGGYSHTDLVTMAADSTGADTGKPHSPLWLTDRWEVKGEACC